MRSSKSRSRNKSNRNNRSAANNINRVFDSSGPEGKVRGTPQQIIDKYSQLSRDAFMAGDRVAGENFQQHAEHYTRLLAEAQRDAEDQRSRQQQGNPQQNGNGNGGQQRRNDNDPADERNDAPAEGVEAPAVRDEAPTEAAPRKSSRSRSRSKGGPQAEDLPGFITSPAPEFDLGESGDESDSGLVETPESKPKKPRGRKPKPARPEGEGGEGNSAPEAAAE